MASLPNKAVVYSIVDQSRSLAPLEELLELLQRRTMRRGGKGQELKGRFYLDLKRNSMPRSQPMRSSAQQDTTAD